MLRNISNFKNNKMSKEHDPSSSSPPWIVFYNSMIIILTAFFVMYSTTSAKKKDDTSVLEVAKPKEEKKITRKAYGFDEIIVPVSIKKDIAKIVKTYGEEKSKDVVQLIRILTNMFHRELGRKKPTVSFHFDAKKQNMAVSLGSVFFFEDGKAKLSRKAKENLKKVAKSLKLVPYMVAIQAFSDKRPIKTKRFPSNWELSSERAVNIMKFLEEENIPEKRLIAEGFGNVPFKKNSKHKQNRRVEIVFMDVIPP